MGSHLILNEDV
ncbi:unnamed protein product, partial [Rotaria sp. Silwood1]